MKRVLTIDSERLRVDAARLLNLMVIAGFEPDVIVGIATGGVLVVDEMPESTATRLSCELRRSQTDKKRQSSLFQRVVARLPYALSDRLRQVEDLIGQRGAAEEKVRPSAGPGFYSDIDEIVRVASARSAQRVAVVDDAVDSGATLAAVVDALRKGLPDSAEVRTAAITVTRPATHRLTAPDFVLYEYTLCRFPWSFDYRSKDV